MGPKVIHNSFHSLLRLLAERNEWLALDCENPCYFEVRKSALLASCLANDARIKPEEKIAQNQFDDSERETGTNSERQCAKLTD